MIELDNITFTYKGARKPALQRVSARIAPGMYILAGENGAGKTTLLHVIAGLLRPQSGKCGIDSVETVCASPSNMQKLFILEDNMYFPGKTICEFASLHSRFYPGFSEMHFHENLKAFGLSGHEPMRSLSLGNLKKSQLAYVIALGVDVLLLDEPTNALDIEGREILRRLLSLHMDEAKTVIVSTHNVYDFEKVTDGAILMRGAELLFAGTEDDVAAKLAFELAVDSDPEAIYSFNQGGRFVNIYPNDGSRETRVDWNVLYMAIHAPESKSVLDCLRK